MPCDFLGFVRGAARVLVLGPFSLFIVSVLPAQLVPLS